MKRAGAFALLFSILFSPLAFSAEIAAPATSVRKLQRGLLNVALSPIELSTILENEKKKDTLIPSWIVGVGKGGVYTAGRALVGVYEILTFPLSSDPIIQPEFAWQKFKAEPSSPSRR